MEKLPKKLRYRPFTWVEAKDAGLTQYALRRLMENGTIERLAHGVYRSTIAVDLSEEEQYKAALLRVGQPSAICLISALAYYHLIDIIPKKTWVLVNADKITNQKDIRPWRRRNPRWNVGINNIGGLKITSIERTLMECLRYNNLAGGTAVVLSAVRLALQEKKVTMSDLLKAAETLGMKKRVLPYLEALS